ncbi:cytoplasmic dynein 1 intermediate chain 2 isoform X4 [Labeo rohita]|uniref:Cytoplasmic dynein 1 intermediate chain 2 isoform X4 n=1 Tax=Labeo rohita TaxID=84645 RepID=A0A498LP67_LABRO|nr:cytoplasmic dynein 1 intermediate chain 2 isoform X4 [Labeo rohita]
MHPRTRKLSSATKAALSAGNKHPQAELKKDAVPLQDDSDLEKKRREAEALLQSMGITSDVPVVPTPMSPTAKSAGTPSEAGSQDSGDGATGPRRGPLKLAMVKVTHVDFPPKEVVSYTKETQTPTMTEQKEAPPHELTEEEKLQILHSEDFMEFFDHSTRIMERALSEHVDVFFDYSGRDMEEKEGEMQAGAKLSLNRKFVDDRWSKQRVVTCLDWSPQHPVYCVNVVGTQNAHNLISISTDGKMCSWSLDMLSQPQNNKPLYSFEDNSDYVYDVMWSPVHPALFACVDGLGRIDLWNLNNDTEVPTASMSVDGSPALNRLRWSQSGREIAVGDSEGQIHIYDVGEQIAVPRNDEWTRFVRTLAEINENRDDAEELAAQRLAA